MKGNFKYIRVIKISLKENFAIVKMIAEFPEKYDGCKLDGNNHIIFKHNKKNIGAVKFYISNSICHCLIYSNKKNMDLIISKFTSLKNSIPKKILNNSIQ